MGYLDSGQGQPDDSDVVLFGSARQRRRRSWLPAVLLGILTATAIGVAIGASNQHPSGRPARPAKKVPAQFTVTYTGNRMLGVTADWLLFARGNQYLVSIQPSVGRTDRTLVPPIESNNPEVALLVSADEVVVRSFDAVPGYVDHDGDPAAPLTGILAPGIPGPLLPGPDPSQAWVMV